MEVLHDSWDDSTLLRKDFLLAGIKMEIDHFTVRLTDSSVSLQATVFLGALPFITRESTKILFRIDSLQTESIQKCLSTDEHSKHCFSVYCNIFQTNAPSTSRGRVLALDLINVASHVDVSPRWVFVT